MIEDESYDDYGPGSGTRYIIKRAQIKNIQIRRQQNSLNKQIFPLYFIKIIKSRSSKSNKALYVIDFGADKTSTAGTFTVQLPTPDATNGLIRAL